MLQMDQYSGLLVSFLHNSYPCHACRECCCTIHSSHSTAVLDARCQHAPSASRTSAYSASCTSAEPYTRRLWSAAPTNREEASLPHRTVYAPCNVKLGSQPTNLILHTWPLGWRPVHELINAQLASQQSGPSPSPNVAMTALHAWILDKQQSRLEG